MKTLILLLIGYYMGKAAAQNCDRAEHDRNMRKENESQPSIEGTMNADEMTHQPVK